MTWLVIYPGEFLTKTLKLYSFGAMDFKLILVALAALNFFLCFIIEVSRDPLFSHNVVPLCVQPALWDVDLINPTF